MSRGLPLVVVLLLTAVFAGCIDDPAPKPSVGDEPPVKVPALFEWKEERLQIEVTVPVILIGFAEDEAARLNESLGPMTVAHGTSDLNALYPVDPDDPTTSLPLYGESFDIAVLPTAIYDVVRAPAALETLVVDNMTTNKIGDRDGVTIYDASLIEDLLFEELPKHGHPIDAGAPTIVLFHFASLGIAEHAWRYTMPHGYLEPVRVFGEKTPILFLDPSAEPDPYVGRYVAPSAVTPGTPRYLSPTEVTDTEAHTAFIEHATHFRVLQGTVYPSPTAPCHAMTFIYAIRDTAIANHLPGYVDPASWYDPAEQLAAFSNLTGTDNVFLDSKILRLPVDDPALDAIARGDFATFEAQRAWLHANWQDYWVPHEGCEPYVSLVVYTDSATPTAAGGVIGIGTYDQSKTYRIALSWVPEPFYLRHGYTGPDAGVIGTADPSVDGFRMVDYLHAHEAGHTIGQRHPHDVSAQGVRGTSAFSSVWSAMSYQTDGRVIDFGAVDHNNFVRNRLAFLLQEAVVADLVGTAEWDLALEHAALYEWQEAGDVLSAALGKPIVNGGGLVIH